MDTGNYVQTSNRASWNEFQKAHLVELLVEFHQPGTRKQNGWSSAAWNDITRHVNAKFSNANFSLKQIKEQEHTLKKQFKIIQHLRNQPGFGWDITTKMVTAPEEVWAPLLKDKEIKRWYNKPFPYYDALHKVYCGFIASGKRKRRSNNFTNNEVEFEPTIPTIHAPREQPDVDVEENSSMSTQPNLNFSQEPSPIHPSISASWREETQLICMQNNSDTTAIHSEEFSVSSAVKTSEQEPNAWKKVVKHAQTCPTEPDHANLENNADLPKSPGLEPFMRNPILELPQGNMGMGQQGDPMARFRSFEMGQLQPFSYLSGNNRPSEAFEEMPGQPSTGQGMTMGNDMYCTQGYHFSIDDCIISPDIPGLESGTLPSPTPEFPPRNMNNSDRAAIHSEEFSVSAAVRTFQQLQGFSKADTVFAITMFIDNARVREAFLSCNEETRAPLIKAIIDQHKQKQKRPGEELEQDANQHCQIRVGMIRIFKDRSALMLSMIGMSKRQYRTEHIPSLRKFRLGACIDSRRCGTNIKIQEGSEKFVVKDQRGLSYEKHYPPMLKDDVWRLEDIGKNGKYHQRLMEKNINSVQDFLKLLNENTSVLNEILDMQPNAWKKVVKHAQTCPTEPDHANLENNADLPKSPGLEPFMRNPILELPQGSMGMGQQGDPMARFRSFEMGQLQPFSSLSGNNRPSEAFEEMPGQPSTGQGMTMGNDMYCTQGYHFSIDDCIISPDIPGLESGTLPSPTPEFPPRNMNNSDRTAIHSEEFSVSAAVRTFQQLQGFSKADTVFAITMFIDNARVREAFLSCNEETRAPLIKAIVDQHKQKQKRPGEELEQDANQHCQIRVGMIRIFKDRSTLKLSMIGMSKRQYHREHVPSLREENLLFVALHESRGLEPFTPNPMPEFQQENMGMGKQVAPESNLVSDQLERFPSNASFNGYNEPNSSNLHADENFEGMLEDTTELPDLAGLEIPDLALLESDQWDEIDLSALLDGGSTSN